MQADPRPAVPHAPLSAHLQARLKDWAAELGFADAAVSRVALDDDAAHLRRWLDAGRHGSMAYMARDPALRSEPERLQPGTVTVISARMSYWPQAADTQANLADGDRAYISRYALGRDYHKLMRARLKQLAGRLQAEIAPHGFRVFADSAPSLEKALARNAGLGWIGKNTLLLNRSAGSFFFLGEIFTDLPLHADAGATPSNHCGSCSACIDLCPTAAIVAPYQLDARRCISYLTIENRDAIPLELRAPIGNRVFGCDDCQLVCPWNRYATMSTEADFKPRHGLDTAQLIELFAWNEQQWLHNTEGMALRRAGYRGWLRNLAVALGNAPASAATRAALSARSDESDPMVREHIEWALQQQAIKSA
ncbi:MAG: queG [Nevskia sp.]|nr:queG [Nevskia sp.]